MLKLFWESLDTLQTCEDMFIKAGVSNDGCGKVGQRGGIPATKIAGSKQVFNGVFIRAGILSETGGTRCPSSCTKSVGSKEV